MKDDEVSEIGKVLSHPLRVKVIRRLRTAKPVSPTQLADEWDEPLGNVSYHLKALAAGGVTVVVRTRHVRGALEHFYTFDGPAAQAVGRALDALDGAKA